MANHDFLKQTLEHYRQQLQKKREEMRPLELMIRQLERELGESPNVLEQNESNSSFSDSLSLADSPMPSSSGRSADIRPDEFFGMSQNEAAKAYLKKVGRAVSLDEIVSSLNKGGAKVGGANPKKTLYVSLMRNPLREFVSPSDNHIGLRAFYPGLPKSEKVKATKGKQNKSSKKNKKLTAKKVATKPIANTLVKPVALSVNLPDKTELQDAIAKSFGDGEELTAQEIVDRVEKTLGRKVTPISIYGMLRSKGKFENNEGKFKRL